MKSKMNRMKKRPLILPPHFYHFVPNLSILLTIFIFCSTFLNPIFFIFYSLFFTGTDGTVRTGQASCPGGTYCKAGVKALCPRGTYGSTGGLGSEKCSGERTR